MRLSSKKIICCIILILLSTWASRVRSESKIKKEAASNDQKKISIKNSIVYHVVKNVKAIESDIFVSRKIDINPLLAGISEMHNIKDRVSSLCNNIPKIISNANKRVNERLKSEPQFVFVGAAGKASHTEAKQRCAALNLQLPEVYESSSYNELILVMRRNKVSTAHAGIYFDQEQSIQRFYSTGLPAWNAFQDKLLTYTKNGFVNTNWDLVMDDANAKFLYTSNGDLACFYEGSPEREGHFRSHIYRETNRKLVQFATYVICQNKWKGDNLAPGNQPKPAAPNWTNTIATIPDSHIFNIPKVEKREAKDPKTNNTELIPLEQYCRNIVAHIAEIKERSDTRIVDLLALVDITINSQSSLIKRDSEISANYTNPAEQTLNRTARGLPSFLFINGVRSIWGLFGFIEKIRTNRRLNKLEEAVSAQTETVDKLSKEVAKHSIAITQLQISTRDLVEKVQALTNRVESLEQRVSALEVEQRIQQVLELVENLAGRSEEALDYGFVKLESIIQMSLLGQTSAFLLPPDKLQEVQNQLNKESTAVIDPEYKFMKSIIVSDPDHRNAILLAIVNVVALSRKSKELIQLTPMPLYQGTATLVPILDYTAVVLDQEGGTFTVVEPDEIQGCLNDHCTTSGPETNVASNSCGIPQFFDRKINSCDFKEVNSDGIFLKRMHLDGVVFNVREEVTAQIFCVNQAQSKVYKLKGSGVVNLPPGCSFSITDKTGRIIKIKSLPISRMIEFQPVDLIIAGPEQIFQNVGTNPMANSSSSLTKLINAHLSSLSSQLTDTSNTVNEQHTYVIILGSLLAVTIVLCLAIAGLLYRYSSRFRQKVVNLREDLSNRFEGAAKKFTAIEQQVTSRLNDNFASSFPPVAQDPRSPPPVPPQSLRVLMHRLRGMSALYVCA